MWSFPAGFMAEFFDNHGMYSLRGRPRWRTVAGGSDTYVGEIVGPWRDRIRTAAPVRRVERLADEVLIEADGRARPRASTASSSPPTPTRR